MYPRDIRVESPQEALIVEQALAMYREMREAATNAPDGAVLSRAESLAVTRGRELTRKSLETVLQEEVNVAEKKGRPPEPVFAEEAVSTAASKRGRLSRRRAR
jgi:hypothetical protein